MIEVMAVLVIVGVMVKLSLPSIQNTILAYRLGAATSSAAAAIQQTRYQAIKVGCSFTLAFTSTTTTYHVQWQAVSGTPPVCATTFTDPPPDVGPSVVSWRTGTGVSMTSSTTFTFSPSGIVTATQGGSNCGMPCSFQLSNGNATKTVMISGVGNVKVTTP
jgi:Tfp pilus assembly protein FimT